MPASPTIRKRRPRPVSESSTAVRRDANAASRPTSPPDATSPSCSPGKISGASGRGLEYFQRTRRALAERGTHRRGHPDSFFDSNWTGKSVPVTIKGDAIKESAESFSLKLSSASSGYTFKDAVGTGTITNDD